MAIGRVIKISGLTKELLRIQNKLDKIEDIATTRALNIILNQTEKEIAVDVSKEYGISQGAIRKLIKPVKATRFNKSIKLDMRSMRSNLLSPRQLKKGGISVRKKGGGRAKITTAPRVGSSRPFVIKATAGTFGRASAGEAIRVPGGYKKIPVFVPKENQNKRGAMNRRVKTLKGSSLPHMVARLKIDNQRLERAVRRDFPAEYRKQLKKAKFVGGF
jgi:hypothetical protein